MTFSEPRIALVLGANGGVGGETAAALVRRGWNVRALVRDSGKAERLAGVSYRAGDALDRAAVVAAAEGAAIIVHAVNPPGYRGWKQQVLPMLENTIAAARASGARILLPGTIYNYDPAAQPAIDEATPQRAFTRKGEIRVEMEARLEAAASEGKAGGVRSLILRAGDYFGPRSTANSWFASGLVKPGQPVKTILYPGDKAIGHAWAYLPDVGETFARLADREAELPACARFHFEGVWDADGTAMVRAIARAAGLTRPDVRRLPWGLLPVAGLFNETMRELAEMRPFWRHPVRLENRRLVAFLGEEPRTPLDVAVRATMAGLDVPVADTAPRLSRAA